MSNTIILVENLSKVYRIGGKNERYRTLRDTINGAVSAPLQRMRKLWYHNNTGSTELAETIWALKDINLEVKQGEVIGIIGRNGSGKSTLLKILSRVTEPTKGKVELHGRVGSLLEVGTGFHPELTGRENIFLNGAILGMPRIEIRRRFDEIVEFAGVGKFIDTPVKHYSSGMYLRLAFAVAAHLDSDILLVDEVLAVGDAEFQRKCLGKMENVAGQGRTVLFVSHNMAAVRVLCKKGLLIDRGELTFNGDIAQTIYRYTQGLAAENSGPSRGQVEFDALRIESEESENLRPKNSFNVRCRLHNRSIAAGFRLFCIIQDANGDIVVHARTDDRELGLIARLGTCDICLNFPILWLRPGMYSLYFKLVPNNVDSDKVRFVSDRLLLDVSDTIPAEMMLGILTPDVKWNATDEKG